ncbi:MAG TPA: hypothetical protein VGT99_06535 [Gammaproteobacteria bacterium]|nr:hypothetical protein [Gammaproteobacteria bacterium]
MRKLFVLTAVMPMLASFAAVAAPASLVENEYAFAQAVADHGIRDGFLMYLDKHAVTLTPLPADAYAIYSKRKPSSTKLSWYPSYALVSASGDFGVDTGPWRADWTQDGKQQDGHGDWLTIWQRDKDGRWHALFDGGVEHAPAAQPAAAMAKDTKVPQLSAGPAMEREAALGGLAQAESAFSAAAGKGSPRAAYAAQAADDLHLFRDGSATVIGKAAVLQAASAQPESIQRIPSGSGAAGSADLGYVYGMTYQAKDAAHSQPLGGYMHVWRRDLGQWKLLMDLELPVAPR